MLQFPFSMYLVSNFEWTGWGDFGEFCGGNAWKPLSLTHHHESSFYYDEIWSGYYSSSLDMELDPLAKYSWLDNQVFIIT